MLESSMLADSPQRLSSSYAAVAAAASQFRNYEVLRWDEFALQVPIGNNSAVHFSSDRKGIRPVEN